MKINLFRGSINIKTAAAYKTIVFLFLLLGSNLIKGQGSKKLLSVGTGTSINGCGFGTQYTPVVIYSFTKKSIEIGPMIQKRKLNFSGVRVNFEYTVYDGATAIDNEYGNESLELFFFAESRYYHNALLSKSFMRLEQRLNPEFNSYNNEPHYKAIEGYAGFGLRIKILKNLKWSNSIGSGGWETLSKNYGVSREKNGASVFLRSSLILQLN